ncbi:FTR1 family iron permease [Macrococcus capreoli]|uniref:FTR1 family iron permease n=1 Tax=Macrococcus capreoli TaxID=2982690 RepID=UPI0021D580EC|nr:FTR1 family protein [Macrococcus sp. TMW 2.2395]MCU7556953.1 FTR1 family protein [Macrococcus sp. TMW 2.2395]
MKRCLILFSIFFFIISSNIHAATSLSDLFIGITDMKSSIENEDNATFNQQLADFEKSYHKLPKNDKQLNKEITTQINELKTSKNKEERLKIIDKLTPNLITLEKKLNPEDKDAKRKKLLTVLTPIIQDMKSSIQKKDYAQALEKNMTLNAAWTANEKVVREDDIGRYGQIETALMMTRIALSKDPVDSNSAITQLDNLTRELNEYIQGKKAKKAKAGDVSILSSYLKDASKQIESNDIDGAKATLTQFITTWPNVEGDIRNSDAALYSQIEQDIPNYAGSLNKSNKDKINIALKELNSKIEKAIAKDHYTFIDSALIMLREGVEALLIIMALISITKNAKQPKATRWIIVGSLIGLLLSVVLAMSFNILFKNVGQGREQLEAYVGILSVIFMILIGVWLHSKSSIQNWNKFINKNITQAISSGSIFTFAFISFLSVFREGAETIIFYAGIAGKISMVQLLSGITLAVFVLILFAIFFDRITRVIPIRTLFFTMSILIFCLAFKILGVSIHTFQVLNQLSNTTIDWIPHIQMVGLYPTIETLIPQIILIIFVVIYLIVTRRKERIS